MSIIDMTKALARALQQDERYLNFIAARDKNDEDAELQDLIGQFNVKRIDLNNELSKDEKDTDQERVNALNKDVRDLYGKIMANTNMAAYYEVKNELDVLLNQVQSILTQAANGTPVDEIDLSACTHDCSTCGGCH